MDVRTAICRGGVALPANAAECLRRRGRRETGRTAAAARGREARADAAVNADAKFGPSRSKLVRYGGGRNVEHHHGVPSLLRWQQQEQRPYACRAGDGFHASNAQVTQLRFFRGFEWWASRARRPAVCAKAASAPQDETQESGAGPGGAANSSEKPQPLSTVPSAAVAQVGGKAGSLSFYGHRSESSSAAEPGAAPATSSKQMLSLLWLLGPFVLVASVVLPPLYLRRIFAAVLEDSLVTDFVILFFTETLFFVGAAVFLYIAHISRQATAADAASSKAQTPDDAPIVYPRGYRTSARIALGVGVLLPMASFVIVWPWTGPAAAAALAPYMIGLLVQLGFEQVIQGHRSPVWPLVPVTFQMYRLHQLNRAAQLVAGLLFSLKGVEATAETMAINGSLQTLLLVLQVLGMLCLWSLGSFLTNQMQTSRYQQSIPSLP